MDGVVFSFTFVFFITQATCHSFDTLPAMVLLIGLGKDTKHLPVHSPTVTHFQFRNLKKICHRNIVDLRTMKIKMFDEKFLDKRKQEQPQKTSYDSTFLVSMVTLKVLSIYTSRLNKGHFTTCRDTIYMPPPPKCYSLLLSEPLL